MTSTSDNDRSVQNASATLLDAHLGLENDPKYVVMIQIAAALPAVGLCHKFSAAIACRSSSSQLVFPNHTPKLKQLIGALIW